jgi:hypothetical protein
MGGDLRGADHLALPGIETDASSKPRASLMRENRSPLFRAMLHQSLITSRQIVLQSS